MQDRARRGAGGAGPVSDTFGRRASLGVGCDGGDTAGSHSLQLSDLRASKEASEPVDPNCSLPHF